MKVDTSNDNAKHIAASQTIVCCRRGIGPCRPCPRNPLSLIVFASDEVAVKGDFDDDGVVVVNDRPVMIALCCVGK